MPEAAAAAGTYVDPYPAFNFKLEIGGITEGHFTEVMGLGGRITPIAYREAGNSQAIHYVPGRMEPGQITLYFGVTRNKDLFTWYKAGVAGHVQRKNLSIVLLDADGTTEVVRWNLVNAWPIEWRGSRIDARSQEVAIESITLVCESLDRA